MIRLITYSTELVLNILTSTLKALEVVCLLWSGWKWHCRKDEKTGWKPRELRLPHSSWFLSRQWNSRCVVLSDCIVVGSDALFLVSLLWLTAGKPVWLSQENAFGSQQTDCADAPQASPGWWQKSNEWIQSCKSSHQSHRQKLSDFKMFRKILETFYNSAYK